MVHHSVQIHKLIIKIVFGNILPTNKLKEYVENKLVKIKHNYLQLMHNVKYFHHNVQQMEQDVL